MSTVVTASASTYVSRKGHIGLVVLGALASGLLLGLVLVLVVFAGGVEHEITGAALVALGAGFVLLAVGSRRFTDQPQGWALRPGLATAAVGLGLCALSPGDHALGLAGWAWPGLLLALVVWSFRGARRALHNWSRRVVLYPALLVLLLVAVGGAFEVAVEATASSSPGSGRTYLVNGHRLYLDCVGEGAPTVVLFNGLGERTPSWGRVQRAVSSSTRVCTYDRAGEGWSGGAAGGDGGELASDLHGLLRAAHVPAPYVLAGHSVGGIYALLYAARHPEQVAGLALIDSATPYQFDLPDYPHFYAMWRRASALLPSLARAGLVPATSPRELSADRAEFAQLPRLFDEAKAVTTLGGKPLAVVTATVGEQRGWGAAQTRLATLSSNSFRQTVAGATHVGLLADEAFAGVTSLAIAHVVRSAGSGYAHASTPSAACVAHGSSAPRSSALVQRAPAARKETAWIKFSLPRCVARTVGS
jgi:pimeloyl-ACP methyl ester carboxylesterase